ncbi:MAG: YegS/Rv2252/BmrU family lipid kinase [Peptoniphilaceae bacterium]|nr:YegS/Rv2252/BmrU family lipid kinase [Peptoniphilaceae bacterium]MDY6018712.1 YegS/Rv2252/BmrU family lipid kinase [Anaerococcus sp.]
MKNLLFIYNPKSGKMIINQYMDQIINYFSQNGYFTTAYATQSAGDARKKVEKYGKVFENIIVSGGDGTLDEVVSGALKADIKPVIGYIPTGSTNDFAKSLNIPVDIDRAIKIALKGKAKELDVGKLEDKFFTYVAAFGSLAQVSYETDQTMKNIFGRSAYIFEGMKTISNLKSYRAKITIDDEVIEDDFIHGMVTNSVSVGGFTKIVGENVGLDDGIFEVMLVKNPKNIMDLNQIISGLTNHKENEFISFKNGKTFKFETKEDLLWTLDGEYGGKTRTCEIEVLHKKLEIRTGLS